MKHTLKITFLLILFFFTAQFVGLAIVSRYIHVEERIDPATSLPVREVIAEDLPYELERPQVEQSSSYIWIMSAVIIGTLLLLAIIKFRKKINAVVWWVLLAVLILDMLFTFFNMPKAIENIELRLRLITRLLIEIALLYILIRSKEKFDVWKFWFFLAVSLAMTIAFSAFMRQEIAALLAFAMAVLKVYKPVRIMQNAAEIFIYGGLAAIFVPVINIFAAFMLLILISVYDIIAVRQTKHMVTLAKFQAKANVFAGLFLPYNQGKAPAKEQGIIPGKDKERIAVLGGGDIGFPLLFAGVVLKDLMLESAFPVGFLKSLIVPVFATIALSYLLVKGKKDKFYPAMPYISAGCFLGYLIVLMLR